jgi:hypothetical protein
VARVSFKFNERFQRGAKAGAHCALAVERNGVLMIFRAIFWIGLVSLLMPHGPDLRLGHPGAGTGLSLPANLRAASGLSRPDGVCGDRAEACAGSLPLLENFQGKALEGLAAVKADIDADRKARAARGI